MLGGGTTSPRKTIDVKTLRQFFMGVLGWTPKTVMMEATVNDLVDAYEGYMWLHGSNEQSSLPSSEFLQEMLKNFPDD